jgi:GNAT superfamily N-acetyltransferase
MNYNTKIEKIVGIYLISTDKAKLQKERIYAFLKDSYWANKRSKELIDLSIENSFCFGLYEDNLQIGFARVITDFAVYAYLCDVYIDRQYRGKGIGKEFMKSIMDVEVFKEIRRFTLTTQDAHSFYADLGFKPLYYPPRWMEIFNENA